MQRAAMAASPVGINRELVPESSGLRVEPEGWEDALARLATDRDTTRAMGDAGRAWVVDTHSVTALYPRFRDAIHS